jgi:hypothetical protein
MRMAFRKMLFHARRKNLNIYGTLTQFFSVVIPSASFSCFVSVGRNPSKGRTSDEDSLRQAKNLQTRQIPLVVYIRYDIDFV